MKTVFSIDRFEGELAVCISDDDLQLDVPRSVLGNMKPNDIFSAEYDGRNLTEITPMPEERDRRLEANRARLHKLFNRNKKS
ncbi:MAG: DUF3006 domain-containing protein [Clostridia bacterium]|nr:DUF3006 domain-containing protein [Clostridia bacterium]